MRQYKLMIPGPVDVPDEVMAAMAASMPHYGDEWLGIYTQTLKHLKQVFGTSGDLFIIPGPGSAASEAAVSSVLAPGDTALVLSNGFFADRWADICRANGIAVRMVTAPWGTPLSAAQVDKALAADSDADAVLVVHHETSTGVLNPLREIAEAAHAHGLPILVDAISSVGGVPLPVDEWKIDVCIAVANKCLEAPPGLAMVSVGERAWEAIEATSDRRRGWYLNLDTWRSYSREWDWHPYPTTVPTNLILALNKSLQLIVEEGLPVRYQRYRRASQLVRDGLGEMGFEMLVDPAYASPLVTAVLVDPSVGADALARHLREQNGILIAGGISDLRGKMLRIGHMGKAVADEYGNELLAGIREFVSSRGA